MCPLLPEWLCGRGRASTDATTQQPATRHRAGLHVCVRCFAHACHSPGTTITAKTNSYELVLLCSTIWLSWRHGKVCKSGVARTLYICRPVRLISTRHITHPTHARLVCHRCGSWWRCYDMYSIKIPLLKFQRPVSPQTPHRPRGVACQVERPARHCARYS